MHRQRHKALHRSLLSFPEIPEHGAQCLLHQRHVGDTEVGSALELVGYHAHVGIIEAAVVQQLAQASLEPLMYKSMNLLHVQESAVDKQLHRTETRKF